MKKTLFFTAAVFVFAGCGKDNASEYDGNGKVALEASAGISAFSRAVDNAWEAGDKIGIFMSGGATAANARYVTAQTDGKFAPAADDQTIYFPIDNNAPKVDFTAYYPYASAQTTTIYPVSVTDQSDQKALDLMVADKVTGRDKTNPAVAFDFKHRMVKLEFTFKAGVGLEDADLEGMGVVVTEQYSAGSCDLNTGGVTASGAKGNLAMKVVADGKSAEATILPSEAEAGRQVVFTLTTGDPFRWTIPADRAFNAGEKHIYEITLSRTAVDVTGTITDWVKQTGSGTAN